MISLHTKPCVKCRRCKERWHRRGDVCLIEKDPCQTSAALVQLYLMGSSVDHGFALFCFGFDVCKPLLEAEAGNQYLLSTANCFTKWLEFSPARSQETPRVIKFLTRSDKVIYRDGFEPKLFGEFRGHWQSTHTSIPWGGGGVHSGLAVLTLKHCASGTGHIPLLLISYRGLVTVSYL